MKRSIGNIAEDLDGYLRLVGERIKTARKLRGITQEEMSNFGFNQRYFQKIESGKTNLTMGMLLRIARTFEIEPHELINPERRITNRLVLEPLPGDPVIKPRGDEDRIPPFTIVEPNEKDKYSRCVPLLSLRAAASTFSDSTEISVETWVIPDTRLPIAKGMFVAQVVGKSMEPKIPDGAYCLFRQPVVGSRQSRILLVEHREIGDPDNGGSYTVKRYESVKMRADADRGGWRHKEIRLVPLNPQFKTIAIAAEQADGLKVIAECVDVLGQG